MTRLPPSLQPLWPAAKVAHRAATRAVGRTTRSSGFGGDRAVPPTALATSRQTRDAEPDHVRLHVSAPGETVRRPVATGGPGPLAVWEEARLLEVPERFVLAVDHGRLVGDYAATITPGGILDLETSPYFGIRGWREHPLYLRPRLPETTHLSGTTVSLASPASTRNYYHSLMDTLPRWALLSSTLPDVRPDHLVLSHRNRWDAELAALVGLDRFTLVEPVKHLALDADTLLVPSLSNQRNLAPPWITEWLRAALPPRDVAGRPRRLYVTRGTVPNTRRLVHEDELWPRLERMGFTRFDPGSVSVQEQIDHFAAAEVVVGVHGAALANLTFAPPGVRVLELFAPRYVDPGYWSIASNIEDSTYRYLVAEPVEPDRPQRRMNRVQDDVELSADDVLHALDELLDT